MARNKTQVAGIALSLLVLAATLLLTSRTSPEKMDTTNAPAETAVQTPDARTGLAQSSDKVSLTVTDGGESGALASDEIVVTLNIDSGWHVNANPASMEFLIPTAASVTADGQSLDIPTQYPPGRVSDITLGDIAIEVYDDGARTRLLPDEDDAALIKDAGGLDLKVRVQACSDSGVCLAPSDLSASLNPADIDAR